MKPQDTLIKFDKSEVESYIRHELNIFERIQNSFNYVHDTLKKLKYHYSGKNIKLTDVKWREGKSYNWTAISSGKDVRLIIRKYDTHFTIYASLKKDHSHNGKFLWSTYINCSFEYFANTSLLDDDNEQDFYCDDPYQDLNKQISTLIDMIRNGKIHGLWNDYSFPRPKHIEVKNIFEGESINSIDKLIYCAEELSCIHLELFAENDLIEILKKVKVGDIIDGKKIKKVVTTVKDDYYHAVGVQLAGGDSSERFQDVYSLTRWYMDDINKIINQKT